MITAMPRIAIAVRDFDKALARFQNDLGMPVVDISDTSVNSLGARLAMCVPAGGSNIELMSPANPQAPLSQSLTRFLKKRGEGLFALMLEAPDPDQEADRLLNKGLSVLPLMAGASGRDIHPKSTHGVLIRIYPVDSFNQSKAPSSTTLGLSGISRAVIAVDQMDEALKVYSDTLGLTASQPIEDRERGIVSSLCHPPSGGMVELVSVSDARQAFAGEVAEHLASKGEGLFALSLESADTMAMAASLKERGLEVSISTPDRLELLPTDLFGARFFIENR